MATVEEVSSSRPTFRAYYLGFFLHPRATVEALVADERRVRFGFFALIVPLVGYVLVYLGLSRSGAYPSVFSPWLALPAESYYRYNVFLLPPSILAAWLLASAVVQMAGRAVSAQGTFEDTASVLGFAISAANWSLLPHDLTVAALGAAGVIDGLAHEHAMNAPTPARDVLWFFMAVYLVAFPLLFTVALGAAHRIRTVAAAFLGASGFVVYQMVFVVFNR
jgi:hypothetical protein